METWSFVNNNTITALHVQFRIYRRVESGLAGWEDCNYNYLLPSRLALPAQCYLSAEKQQFLFNCVVSHQVSQHIL